MITAYIIKNLNKACYKILEDGTYFGEISSLKGVWASEKTLEKCRETLREVLEEWLILKLRDGDEIFDLQMIKKSGHKILDLKYA
ncbi:MAG: type II toxin-antitoxin system HicB family antitoxin [Patescibacteria group bacterium]|nr:type II toxin-antitoxin system HicB family antitoxin [Patescibacteria group bacterium]